MISLLNIYKPIMGKYIMSDKNSDKGRKKKDRETVEQNLSDKYIPKSKLGDLPSHNELDEKSKEMNKIKEDIDRLKKELTTSYKFIECIGIVPAQASKKIEEEYEVSTEDSKRELIHTLVVIPEDKFKDIQKIKVDCIKKAKDINDKIWLHIMTPVDIWNLGLDSKFDIIEALGMSYPILDKGLLGALRISSIHKSMVLRKFEKYVTSYVVAGSLVRGEAKPTSDVDIFIVIDDTDVKRMPRFELKEKLRSVIFQYIQEATAIAGSKNPLNVQVYLLTEFWEAVKDAHPVMFTFIRDGVPLYDRGAFLPWKSLLRMGKIKPSPEAIDMFMSSGDKLSDIVNRRLMDILVMDIFWGVSTPTQGLLMMYGLAPAVPKETVRLFREVFVEKEKLVEPKYADILEEIIIKYYKGYEHGKIKKVSGSELQKIYENATDYMKRLKELRNQIEKRIHNKSIDQVHDDVFKMIGALLNKTGEDEILKAFDRELVKKGKMPKRFLNNLKQISKIKKDMDELSREKTKKITGKEIVSVENARKLAQEITNTLIEYVQRKDLIDFDKRRFILKTTKKEVEVIFSDKTYIIDSGKIFILEKDELKESSVGDLNNSLKKLGSEMIKISQKEMSILKKIFGEFELIY